MTHPNPIAKSFLVTVMLRSTSTKNVGLNTEDGNRQEKAEVAGR